MRIGYGKLSRVLQRVSAAAAAGRRRTMHFGRLISFGGGGHLPLISTHTVIGRSPDKCHVVIDDPSVSRVHCAVTLEDGRVTLQDLGSSNGTWVATGSIQETLLPPLQAFWAGQVRLLIEWEMFRVRDSDSPEHNPMSEAVSGNSFLEPHRRLRQGE